MSAARVVCFDLGGVLVRICRSWDEACSRVRLPYRSPELLTTEASRRRRWSAVDRYHRGALEAAEYYAELSRAIDGIYSVAEVELIHHAWTLEEYPGVRELVTGLNHTPGVVTACLSNTNGAHWARLVNEDGRAEYPTVLALQHHLASHLLRCAKPDPDIYAHAQQAFGAFGVHAPEQVVFFDDLPENVKAAHAHGWTAFQVDPLGDTASQMRAHLASVGVGV
jgi:FMN phosphatase YigB (HAD superfamily)